MIFINANSKFTDTIFSLRARAFLPLSTTMLLRLVTEQRNAALVANDAGSFHFFLIEGSVSMKSIMIISNIGVAVGAESVSVLYAALRALWLTIDVAGLAFAPQY